MGEVFKLNHCYNMDCLPAMELFKINYNPDLIAVAWAVPVLLNTLVNKAYDWNNEVRDWD